MKIQEKNNTLKIGPKSPKNAVTSPRRARIHTIKATFATAIHTLLLTTTVITQIQDFPITLNLALGDSITFNPAKIFPRKQISSIKTTPAKILNVTKTTKTVNDSQSIGYYLSKFGMDYFIDFETCHSTQSFSQIKDKFQIWMICSFNRIVVFKIFPYQKNPKLAVRIVMLKTIEANFLARDKIPGMRPLKHNCLSLAYSDSLGALWPPATCCMRGATRSTSRRSSMLQFFAIMKGISGLVSFTSDLRSGLEITGIIWLPSLTGSPSSWLAPTKSRSMSI